MESSESSASGGEESDRARIKQKQTGFYYMRSKVLKEQQQQKLAALHCRATNTWFIFAPTILITLGSAIAGLFIQSPVMWTSDNAKDYFFLAITVLQLVLSLIQSISKQVNYGGKAVSHQSAASSLLKIYDQAGYYKKLHNYRGNYSALFEGLEQSCQAQKDKQVGTDTDTDTDTDEEKKKGNEENTQPTSGSTKDKKDGNYKVPEKIEVSTLFEQFYQALAQFDAPIPMKIAFASNMLDSDKKGGNSKEDLLETLNAQFYQAIAQVNSPIPMEIAAAFNMLDSRITIMNKSLLRENNSGKIKWEKVYRAAYYQLSETITHSRGWPLVIPSSKWAVEQALKDFKHSLQVGEVDNGALLKELLARAGVINKTGDELEEKIAETEPLIPNTVH